MAILDVARSALRPTNSIELAAPTQPPQPAQPAASQGAASAAAVQPDTAARTLALQAADRPAAAKKPAAYTTEPEAIAKRYYIEDKGSERRYYDDYMRQALAMRATTSVISTKREDLNTIRAMLTVAEARGWQAVQIKGSDAFKREAWIEAHTRGIEARGYKASDLDRQEADRRRAERGQPSQPNQVAPAAAAPAVANPSAPAASMPAAQPAAARTPTEAKPPKAASKTAPDAAPAEPGKAAQVDSRRAAREVQAQLSPDARLMLAALTEKIDRQMNRLNAESKAQIKAFAAAELIKKEHAEGPVVLSAAQKRAASAPEPVRDAPKPVPAQARRMEPEPPRRTLSR